MYGLQPFSDTKTLVNPEWRTLDREKRSLRSKLNRKVIYLHSMDGQKRADPEHKDHKKWVIKKSETLDDIEDCEADIEMLKNTIKGVSKHIQWSELPEEQRFQKMKSASRTLMNTIGMICYRSETALASILMEDGGDLSQARAVLQALFKTTADFEPDIPNNLLHIHMHTASTPATNRWLLCLFEHLNQTETIYPGTDLKMVFHSIVNRSVEPADGDIPNS